MTRPWDPGRTEEEQLDVVIDQLQHRRKIAVIHKLIKPTHDLNVILLAHLSPSSNFFDFLELPPALLDNSSA